MDDTRAIGGIRLSDELVQIELWEKGVSSNRALLDLLARAAAAKISIAHLHQVRRDGGVQTTLCVDSGSFTGFGLSGDGDAQERSIRQGIGTLTLYPHGCDLSFVLRFLQVLARAGIAVYGLSTSISALVVHMDYALLDAGAEAALTLCRLPDNHSPMRPVVVLGDQVVETAAVYWESIITIYGMQMAAGQILWQAHLPTTALVSLEAKTVAPSKFTTLFLQKRRSGMQSVSLLAAAKADPSALLKLENEEGDRLCWSSVPVDMVSFHGPHFHERYGIAQRCCRQLEDDGLTIAALGCTGASMHIITEAGTGGAVQQSLGKICSVPSFR